MKKLFITMALMVSAAMLLTGCGDKKDDAATDSKAETSATLEASDVEIENDKEAKLLSQINAADYVTLGDYKGLEGELSVEETTEDDIQQQIDYALQNLTTQEEVTDRPVKDGDIVNIDYVGKKDGEEFKGGSATGYNLTIGSGTFIPGFESGLVGHEIGETVDLNLTFPEQYQTADLAGQDVVFTVTINSIKEKVVPELTDEVAVSIEPTCKTADEFKAYVKERLESSKKSTAISQLKSSLLASAVENATVNKVPQWLVDDKYEFFRASVEAYASSYGVSMDDFISQALQQTTEEFEKESNEYALTEAKQALVVCAIAQAEGIEATEDEIKKAIEENASSLSNDNYEDEIKTVEGRSFAQYVQLDKVTQFLYDNATITEK